MYYYAYVNDSNICQSVYALPSAITDSHYITITEEQYTSQSVVGKQYSNGEWVDPVYYYAILDDNDICTSVINLPSQITMNNYIQIDSLDSSLIGKRYNRETSEWEEVGFAETAAHSTDEINVGTSNVCLTNKLNELETAIANVETGTGSDGEDGADGTTVVVGTTTTGEAGTQASVTGVLNENTNTLTLNFTIPKGDTGAAGEASTVDAYTKTEVDTLLNGKANSTHTHDYAPSTHTHTMSDITGLSSALSGKADSSHSHSEYASSTHTHSGYASSSHTHSNYFSTSGGTITGETNFSGGLVRLKGVQTLYNSGSMITLSSNNTQTMIAGSAIYSKVAISVSSDERVKENIAPVDAQTCIDFINAIDVKTFNYKGNETPCVGVIAQQLEKASPELAKRLVTKGEDGMLGVKTSDLVFPLIVAVQELLKKK